MPAHITSETDYGEGRVVAQLRGRGVWHVFLKQTPDGSWRAWLQQGGLSALSEDEALAWAEQVMDARESPPAT